MPIRRSAFPGVRRPPGTVYSTHRARAAPDIYRELAAARIISALVKTGSRERQSPDWPAEAFAK